MSRDPTKEEKLMWIRTYLRIMAELKGLPASDVTEEDVNKLYATVSKFHWVSASRLIYFEMVYFFNM